MRSVISPDATNDHHLLLTALGPWIAPSNMTFGAMVFDNNLYLQNPAAHSGERHVAVHFPRTLLRSDATKPGIVYYENPPDWYSATVPALVTPTDLNGTHILTTSASSMAYDEIPLHAKTFQEWTTQLPPSEKRMLSSGSILRHMRC